MCCEIKDKIRAMLLSIKNMTKNVTILVCNSNMFIPFVLTEILSNRQKCYLVISDIDSIELFFNAIKLDNVIFFKYGTNYKFFDIIRSKRHIMSLTKTYRIERLIFFHAEFGELVNWFISQISKDIPIFYCSVFPRLSFPEATFKIKMKEKIKQYIYWGINMDILAKGSNYAIPILSSNFFKKNRVQQLSIETSSSLIKHELSAFFDKNGIKSSGVLLTGTVVDSKYVDKNEYISKINDLIDQIGTDNIVSKCHPRFSSLYGKEKDLKQIPHYIPGNLIIDNFDFIIGYESSLLVEASKAGKLAISLLEIFNPIRNELKQELHAFFDSRLNNEGQIFYPQNIQELISLLDSYHFARSNKSDNI